MYYLRYAKFQTKMKSTLSVIWHYHWIRWRRYVLPFIGWNCYCRFIRAIKTTNMLWLHLMPAKIISSISHFDWFEPPKFTLACEYWIWTVQKTLHLPAHQNQIATVIFPRNASVDSLQNFRLRLVSSKWNSTPINRNKVEILQLPSGMSSTFLDSVFVLIIYWFAFVIKTGFCVFNV